MKLLSIENHFALALIASHLHHIHYFDWQNPSFDQFPQT